jgi:hypothetical protein
MKVELPLGDVVDKITILLLKQQHIEDPRKLANVEAELDTLRASWFEAELPPLETLEAWHDLCAVNGALWLVEDDLRLLEAEERFDLEFVAKARSVYKLNDRRAALKRAINVALGSTLVEEKSYAGGDP